MKPPKIPAPKMFPNISGNAVKVPKGIKKSGKA